MSETQQTLFKLEAETLPKLDRGTVAAAVDGSIRLAADDCLDRPSDERPRKVILQIEVKPIVETHGNTISCSGARAVCKVRLRLPDKETGDLDLGVRKTRKGGMFTFNELSPTDHRAGAPEPQEDD